MKGISTQKNIYEITFYRALRHASPDDEQAKIFGKYSGRTQRTFLAYCNLINHLLYDDEDFVENE